MSAATAAREPKGSDRFGARAQAVTGTLRAAGTLGSGETVIALRQLPAGWSRHTYAAETSGGLRFIVRVKPTGALLDTDLGLEHRLYEALAPEAVATPRVHGLEASEDTPFGGPFFVMEHLPGEAPNMYAKADRAALQQDFEGPRGIAEDMARNLATIHATPFSRLPADLPAHDFAAACARWRTVYEQKRLVRDPVVEEAFAWLADNAPRDEMPGLVHGDYRIGNTLVADGRVRAILDWELTYRGDVRFDLGYLALPRAAGKHLRARGPLMGCFAEQGWFLERYSALTGRAVSPETLRPFQVLSIMMLLATQFQAVWMYVHGRTTDFRMVWSRFSFPGLRQDLTRLMAW